MPKQHCTLLVWRVCRMSSSDLAAKTMKNATKEFHTVFNVKRSPRSKVRALYRVKWGLSVHSLNNQQSKTIKHNWTSVLDNHRLHTNFKWTSFSFDSKICFKSLSLSLSFSRSHSHTLSRALSHGEVAEMWCQSWHPGTTQSVFCYWEKEQEETQRKPERNLLFTCKFIRRLSHQPPDGKLCVCDQLLLPHWILIISQLLAWWQRCASGCM